MADAFHDRVRLVQSRILQIRGEKVILDTDLAGLYGVSTKRLNEQVKRNAARFPDDFVFRLTDLEKKEVVANCDHLSKLQYSSGLPQAFTEHGAIMAATVLKSDLAVQMSVFVVRAFVWLRKVLMESDELRRRLDSVESRLSSHDAEIAGLVAAIRQLLGPQRVPVKRRIGFHVDDS